MREKQTFFGDDEGGCGYTSTSTLLLVRAYSARRDRRHLLRAINITRRAVSAHCFAARAFARIALLIARCCLAPRAAAYHLVYRCLAAAAHRTPAQAWRLKKKKSNAFTLAYTLKINGALLGLAAGVAGESVSCAHRRPRWAWAAQQTTKRRAAAAWRGGAAHVRGAAARLPFSLCLSIFYTRLAGGPRCRPSCMLKMEGDVARARRASMHGGGDAQAWARGMAERMDAMYQMPARATHRRRRVGAALYGRGGINGKRSIVPGRAPSRAVSVACLYRLPAAVVQRRRFSHLPLFVRAFTGATLCFFSAMPLPLAAGDQRTPGA